MNTDLAKLIELEKVDHEIARLTEEVAALPRRVVLIEERLAEHKAARSRKPKLPSRVTRLAGVNMKPISRDFSRRSSSIASSPRALRPTTNIAR